METLENNLAISNKSWEMVRVRILNMFYESNYKSKYLITNHSKFMRVIWKLDFVV